MTRRSGPDDDLAVFEALYPSLRRFAAIVADSDMDPDDLLQDALVATLQRQALIEIRRPGPYLRQAIVNVASSRRRRSATLRRYLPRLWQDSAGRDHYPSDLAILDVLSPVDRAVVYFADVEGLPHGLIAEELGLTLAAVRKRASRSRKQLRLAVGPEIVAVEDDGEEEAG